MLAEDREENKVVTSLTCYEVARLASMWFTCDVVFREKKRTRTHRTVIMEVGTNRQKLTGATVKIFLVTLVMLWITHRGFLFWQPDSDDNAEELGSVVSTSREVRSCWDVGGVCTANTTKRTYHLKSHSLTLLSCQGFTYKIENKLKTSTHSIFSFSCRSGHLSPSFSCFQPFTSCTETIKIHSITMFSLILHHTCISPSVDQAK